MDDEKLKKYFEFDESDLFANRNGNFTPKQMERLKGQDESANKGGLIVGIILMVIAVAPTILEVFTGAPWYFTLIWSVIWIPIWGLIGFGLVTGAFSARKYTLAKAEGPINIVKVSGRSGGSSSHSYSSYELHIADHEFDVESDIADFMMQGDVFAFYFREETDDIVSVEWLGKAK